MRLFEVVKKPIVNWKIIKSWITKMLLMF